ncbi:hypothetical protein BGZ76_000212 [Entomortierella beljakovae]|nr:hypothetical protein BGZ76_000212 [Entomortierella beljakovae]
MTSIPELTPDSHYGNAWDSTRLASKDGWILDPQNRVIILHGLNLSGGTKMPFYLAPGASIPPSTSNTVPTGSTSSKQPSSSPLPLKANNTFDNGAIPGVVYSYTDENFYNHRDISFVNRPFPLDEADVHFERMARWGCQCLRVLVPWEALEHSGPGIYDEDYIEYLIKLLKVAAKYGLKCFLDPHVDCWSRFTGGSGMPGWTLELAGLDMTKFGQTGAAVIQNTYKDKQDYPKMIWATNSIKLGAATMYSLFFAGQIFAPKAMVPLSATVLSHFQKINSTIVSDEAYRRGVPGGVKAPSPVQNLVPIPRTDQHFIDRGMVNIQHFLQCHFIEAFVHLTQRISQDDIKSKMEGKSGLIDGGTVMGFDTLNEPSPGYLNHPDLNKLLDLADLQIGTCPTPFQGIQLAQGETVKCQVWETGGLGPMNKGSIMVNEEKINLWNRPYWNPQKFSHSSPNSLESIVSHLKLSATKVFHSDDNQTTTTTTTDIVDYGENNHSKSGWREPLGYSTSCLWAEHGVWDPKTGKLLLPNYFEKIPVSDYTLPGLHSGKEVEWKQDFWLPFVNTLSLRLRQQDAGLTMFVEPPINEAPPVFRVDKALIRGAEDNIIHMFQALTRWRPLKSFRSQPDTPSTDQDDTQLQNNDDNTGVGEHMSIKKTKRRSISTEPDGNTCPHAIFDPLGDVGQNVVVAPHFYDGYSNVTRDFIPFTLDYLGYKRKLYWSVLGALKFGWSNVEKTWAEQVKGISSDIRFAMGNDHGILMGETGLPMDMHRKISYLRSYGNPKQSFAMRLLLDAMDESMMSFTLWNYCPDNSNYWGDRWNGEDFSVWCERENSFSKPDFKPVSGQYINLEGASSSITNRSNTSVLRQNVTLTEIAADLASAREEAGCQEGFLWWLCLPKTNVWTSRVAPKKMVVITVDSVSPSSSGENLTGSESNLISAVQKKQYLSNNAMTSWQDLLPLSLQIERSRLDFYGGLRVAESFVRAYPLAVWGVPILYRFEPGKPISDRDLVSNAIGRKKTKDVNSWENSFYLMHSLDCTRRAKRDAHTSNHSHSRDEIQGCGDDDDIQEVPPTDVFLPRFHFSLDSPVGVDQFESLNYIQELQDDLHQQHQSITTVQKSPADKGRWHRLEIQVSDGNYSLQADRQILQYWSSSLPAVDLHNPASKAEFFDQVESRVQKLFSLGWNGTDGIATTSERDWIKKLWKEMKRGQAEIESMNSASLLSCLWPFNSKKPNSKDLEPSRKLKRKEIKQRWRDRVGLPDGNATFCNRCGHLEVMHLHVLSAKLQVWSGIRG